MTTIDQSRDVPSGRPILSKGVVMVGLGVAAWAVVAVGGYLVFRGIFG